MFVAIEHRLRGDEAHMWVSKEVRRPQMMRRPPLKVTTSGGVMVALANHLTALVSPKGGKVESTEGSEGRSAEAWVKCQDGFHTFAAWS